MKQAGMTYDTEKAEALMEKLASENVAKIRANKMCAERPAHRRREPEP